MFVGWVFWIVLALMLLVPVVELFTMRRMIRRKLEEEGLLDPKRSEE